MPAETLSGYGNIPNFVADINAQGEGAISNGNAIDGVVPDGKGDGDTSSNGGATTGGSDSSTTSSAPLQQISAVLVSLAGLMFWLVGM